MKGTAYLVIFIDTKVSPPVVVSAGIFSEKKPTTDLLRQQACCLLVSEDESFIVARARIASLVATNPHYDWVGKLPGWEKLR